MNKLLALMIAVPLLSNGVSSEELKSDGLNEYMYSVHKTNIIIPADNEYYDVVSMQNRVISYGDLEEYMSKEFKTYKQDIIIGYMQNLENKMANCKIEYKEEFSKGRYLIFLMEETRPYWFGYQIYLAWEIDNPKGGFVIFANTDIFSSRLITDNVLSLMDGEYASTTDILFNLDNPREKFKIGSVYSVHGIERIGDTDWVIYDERAREYISKVDSEHAGEVFIYNMFTEERIELRKVDVATMWAVSSNQEDNNIYSIIKYIDYEGKVLDSVDEVIDFRDEKYASILESPGPITLDNTYFEYINYDDYDSFWSRLVVKGEYIYFYEMPYAKGVCESVETWDTENFPENTLTVCKIIRDGAEGYLYAYESDGKIIIEKIIDKEIELIKILGQ